MYLEGKVKLNDYLIFPLNIYLKKHLFIAAKLNMLRHNNVCKVNRSQWRK